METLNQKFLEICRQFADREAMCIKLSDGWHGFSYRSLEENSFKIASWLLQKRIPRQSRIAIILDNCPEWAFVYFGILLAGCIAVPLDIQLREQDMEKLVEDAGVNLVFLQGRLTHLIEKCEGLRKDCIVLKIQDGKRGCRLEEILARQNLKNTVVFPEVSPDDTASLLYSSGTTAYPKGIELTHKNFYSNFESLEKLSICHQRDNFLSLLPLFHAYAFMATLVYPLFIGARIIYPLSLRSDELAQIMSETDVSVLVGVPELFNNMIKSIMGKINKLPVLQKIILRGLGETGWVLRKATGLNLLKMIYKPVHHRFGGKLRYMVSGGAKLEPEVARAFSKLGFTVLEGYGLTETSPIVSINPAQAPEIGTVGKVLPQVDVEIVNPDAQGIGEIAIRGDNVMKGYYRQPEQTTEVIREGWFYSGDLGFVDSKGYLHICGRTKEVMVLSSGKNIFPEEIEQYYNQSIFIKELGVFLSDEESGEILKAVIVPDFEVFKRRGIVNVFEKVKWDVENISKTLPSYKRIMGFVISKEELPRTRLGKIKRFQLKGIYQEGLRRQETKKESKEIHPQDSVLMSLTGKKVVEFLRAELSLRQDVKGTDHLELDLGIDSLTRVEIVSGLEKLFGIHLEDEVLAKMATVKDVVKTIEELLVQHSLEGTVPLRYRPSWTQILSVESRQEQFKDIELSPGISSRVFSPLMKGLLFLGLKIFGRIQVLGRQHISPRGPYIICCNHASYLDAFVVIAGLPLKVAMQTYCIGLKEIFCHPSVRWAINLARLIPIDPAGELIKAMRSASYLLKNDKIVCIFPEGQRSIDGEIKKFKKGIGILAKELGMDVLPVVVEGTYHAWPRTSRFPKPHRLKVIFGETIKVQNLVYDENRPQGIDEYQWITERIREEMLHLQNQIRS